MDINLIRKYVLRNKVYTRKISHGYYTPNTIKRYDGYEIPLFQNRNEALSNNSSSYSRKFEEDINNRYPGIKYIKEFPIIIENKDDWGNILFCYNLENDPNKNYFLIDYFFPYLGFCVEIDSEYHDPKEFYDKARDLYIYREYGLETIRFYKYNNKNCLNLLDKYLLINNKEIDSSIPIPIDYSETIINNFIEKNKQALEFIDNLKYYLGPWKFYTNNTIKLNHLELERIDYFTFNRNIVNNPLIKGSPEQLLLNGIVILLKQLYNKNLIIL